jgi:UDP-glucose 4-epimerase
MEMNYRRALITGGAGLVGSHIADLLVCQGLDEIVIFDDFSRGRQENLNHALANGNVRIIEGDIRDRAAVREAMDQVDVVFHQAAIREACDGCARERDLQRP